MSLYCLFGYKDNMRKCEDHLLYKYIDEKIAPFASNVPLCRRILPSRATAETADRPLEPPQLLALTLRPLAKLIGLYEETRKGKKVPHQKN
jgi:hypothetical protein